jgi:hypothetical protein
MTSGSGLADMVGTVRIHARRDAVEARETVSDAMARLTLHSRGPSPRSILVVRTVDDRAWDVGREPAAFAAELERQVDLCWRTARRPGGEAASANAVVFRDLVELLAHYIIDLSTGRVGERWWWRALHGQLAPSGRVSDVLSEHIWFAPQVLMEVHRGGRLRDVAGAVDLPSCAQLTSRLAEAHAAPALNAALDLVLGRADAAARPVAVSEAPACLRDALSSIDGRARRLFVAAAFQLASDPPVAHSLAFAASLAALADEADLRPVERRPASPDASTTRFAGPRSRPGVVEPASTADVAGAATSAPTPPAGPVAQFAEDTSFGAGSGATRRSGMPAPPVAHPSAAKPVDAVPPSDQQVLVGRDDHGSANRPPPDASLDAGLDEGTDPLDPLALPDGMPTHLGGIFFLIEALRQLRSSESVGADWEVADRCGWWGVLEGLGSGLLPPDHPDLDDPVWAVLRDLASGPARAELPGLLDDLQPTLVAFLTERLRCTPDEVPPVLLEHTGRVFSSRTHVDVQFPLSGATVPVRRAGFDRDPGWVPELGRVVLFHFDDDSGGEW